MCCWACRAHLQYTMHTMHAFTWDTLKFYNSWIEHGKEMKLACTSIDFPRRVAKGFRSSWLQIMGDQLNNRSPYIRHTNRNCYLLHVHVHNISWIRLWRCSCDKVIHTEYVKWRCACDIHVVIHTVVSFAWHKWSKKWRKWASLLTRKKASVILSKQQPSERGTWTCACIV